MKKHPKQRIDTLLREVEILFQEGGQKRYIVPKPSDSENDVYVIEGTKEEESL